MTLKKELIIVFVLYHNGTKLLDFAKISKNTFSLIMNHKLEIMKIFPLVLLALKKINNRFIESIKY